MDIVDVPTPLTTISTTDTNIITTTISSPRKERELSSFILMNPSRVIPSQIKYISTDLNQRYVPVGKKRPTSGIIMLMDTCPDEPEDVKKGIYYIILLLLLLLSL